MAKFKLSKMNATIRRKLKGTNMEKYVNDNLRSNEKKVEEEVVETNESPEVEPEVIVEPVVTEDPIEPEEVTETEDPVEEAVSGYANVESDVEDSVETEITTTDIVEPEVVNEETPEVEQPPKNIHHMNKKELLEVANYDESKDGKITKGDLIILIEKK